MGIHVPLFPTKFPLCSLVPYKYLSFDFGVPCPLSLKYQKHSSVPMFPALFFFCSLVSNNCLTMFPCSLKPLGEPQYWAESQGGEAQCAIYLISFQRRQYILPSQIAISFVSRFNCFSGRMNANPKITRMFPSVIKSLFCIKGIKERTFSTINCLFKRNKFEIVPR